MKISRRKRLILLWNKLKTEFHRLNTFASVPPSKDPLSLKNQKISTWLFILLLTISIAVLLFYSIFIPVQKTVTVKQPTYDQYLTLYSKYLNNLQCPCKTVSVTYERFLQLNYTLHHICSSFLVSEQWIRYLVRSGDLGGLHPLDFRVIGRYAFQALRSFCQLTDEIIQMSLSGFYETQYVSAYLTASDLFRRQNEAQAEQFKSSTSKAFASSLLLIRQTTQANALMTATQANFFLYFESSNTAGISFPIMYFGCSCAETALCFRPAGMFMHDTVRFIRLFAVPGFYGGCYIIESLLVSSFQCFYDKQCFDNLTYLTNSTLQINVTVLNASLSNKFSVNSTVGDMIDALMVEQWNLSIAFAKYYAECEPKECSYTIGSRNDAIYIVITMFGLVGGLVTVLRMIVPRLIDYIRRKRSDEKEETGELSGRLAQI